MSFFNRRHFLVRTAGTVAASAVVAVPVAASESPADRIARLKVELAAALADEFGQGFEVVVTDNEATPASCIAPDGIPRTIMLRANAM